MSVRRLVERAAAVICVSAVTLLAIRAWDSQRGPELEPWHTYAPHEPSRSALATLDWDGYVAAEADSRSLPIRFAPPAAADSRGVSS